VIVGISGKMCAGKTTLAKYLCKRFGDAATIYPFAFELKSIVDDIARRLKLSGFDKRTPHGRAFLQWFGQRMRAVYSDIWIEPVARFADSNRDKIVIVDDVRFVNEALFVKSRRGVLIRVEAPEDVRIERFVTTYGWIPDSSVLNDVSEVDLDTFHPWDVILTNDSSLEAFFSAVDGITNELRVMFTG